MPGTPTDIVLVISGDQPSGISAPIGPARPNRPLIIVEPPTVNEVQVKPLEGDSTPIGHLSVLRTSSSALARYRVVKQANASVVAYADEQNSGDSELYLGITTDIAATSGRLVTVCIAGVITSSTWNWNTGPVFCGSQGQLTQSPTSTSFQVATALSPTIIALDFPGQGVVEIGSNSITLGKLSTVSTSTFLGRSSSGTGNVETLTAAQARALLNVADGATANMGTVTTVGISLTNGITGTVSNNTTAPAISLSLGAITPTSVAASGPITGSNVILGFKYGITGVTLPNEKYPTTAEYAFTISQANSSARAGVAATSSTVFTIKKNNSTIIGTFTFAPGSNTASTNIISGVVVKDDLITIEAPGIPDSTLANISFTVRA